MFVAGGLGVFVGGGLGVDVADKHCKVKGCKVQNGTDVGRGVDVGAGGAGVCGTEHVVPAGMLCCIVSVPVIFLGRDNLCQCDD